MKPHAFAERTQSSRQIKPLRWGAAPRSPTARPWYSWGRPAKARARRNNTRRLQAIAVPDRDHEAEIDRHQQARGGIKLPASALGAGVERRMQWSPETRAARNKMHSAAGQSTRRTSAKIVKKEVPLAQRVKPVSSGRLGVVRPISRRGGKLGPRSHSSGVFWS